MGGAEGRAEFLLDICGVRFWYECSWVDSERLRFCWPSVIGECDLESEE